MVRFEVLGPVRIVADTDEVPVTGRRERIVLAMLLLDAGRPVRSDRLIDAVWGGTPPASARNQIQVTVSHLRRRLARAGTTAAILTEHDGYRIRLDGAQLDLADFRVGVGNARRTAAAGEAARARDLYRGALARWRGPAFAGIDSTPVRHVAAALDEERLHAHEECLQLELELGAGAELATELTELIAGHPYRERLHAFLMRALDRAGRRADALAAFRRIRQLLHDELGTEPGAELQQLHRAILSGQGGRDPAGTRGTAGTGGAARPPVPAQLPPDVPAFTGRTGELARLDSLLPGRPSGPAAVVISVVDGSAGVGKTALAVHWAHRVRDQFPDGQLYIDLRGYAPGPPLPPIEALARFLPALGVPAERMPSTVEEAAAMYRSLLADKRMLVLLDNTAEAGQVRPLLPAGAGCMVLITSRNQLPGLVAREGAHRMTLDVLSPAESLALLGTLLGEPRVRAEPLPAAELARACAHLPLALRITAANLHGRPHSSVAAQVRQLRGGDRLANLSVPGDEQVAVRAAFDLSYARLPPPARRLFRLLGLVPGTDVTAGTAAAVAGTTADQADRMLGVLVHAHLVDEHATGRYAFHDLLRAYAAGRAERDETGADLRAARQRLYRYLLRRASDAQQVLYPHMLRLPGDGEEADRSPGGEADRRPGEEAGEPFGDHTAALGWLDAERSNLVAAVIDAHARGDHRSAWLLADALRGYFLMRMHIVEGLATANAALAAAQAGRDLPAQAMAQLSLGGCHWRLRHTEQATRHLRQALRLARAAGWAQCEAGSLGNLGAVHAEEMRIAPAIDYYQQALASHERTGRRHGQATVLVNIASNYLRLGRLDDAVGYAERGLAVNIELDSRDGLAHCLLVIGEAHWRRGRLDAARSHADRARKLYESIGNRTGEGDALRCLGDVALLAGDLAGAEELFERGLLLAREIGHHRLEADLLHGAGSVALLRGDPTGAVDAFQRAVSLAGDRRYWAIEPLLGLAAGHAQNGQLGPGRHCGGEALDAARKAGCRLIEGRAMTVLAQISLADGAARCAADLAERALAVHRLTGHRHGEARAHATLGSAYSRTGDRAGARNHWRQAHAIFTEIGTPEAAELAPLLAIPTARLRRLPPARSATGW